MKRQARGFSMLEIFVVVAIIGILSALILPAVMAAREQARRGSCASNLRQFGLGIVGYHDMHQCFPPGRLPIYDRRYAGSNPPCTSLWVDKSVHAFLLPFLEMDTLYQSVNQDLSILSMENGTARKTQVGLFICPSESGRLTDTLAANGLLPISPDQNGQPWSMAGNCYRACYGSLPHLAMPGYFADCRVPSVVTEQVNGAFNDVAPLRARDIGDGLSQTMFVSEVALNRLQEKGDTCPNCVPKTDAYWVLGDLGDTLFSAMTPPNFDRDLEKRVISPSDIFEASAILTTAGSNHDSGVQILLGDGSVKFISDSVDSWPMDPVTKGPIGMGRGVFGQWLGVPPGGIWQRLATRNGGD